MTAPRTLPALAALLIAAGPALAAPAEDTKGIITLQVENDAISTLRGTSDQYYTSGLRLGYTSGTNVVPEAIGRIGRAVWGDGVQRISIDISQSIFTPRNTQIAPANPRDRPYAGYLNATLGLLHDTDNARSLVAVSLGIIGPSAMGRAVQNGFHNIIGDPETQGWGSQLKDEPTVQLLAERTYRVPITRFSGLETDVLPSVTVGVGTVRDYVQAGFSLRLGQGLNSDFGAPRIRPAISGSDAYTPNRPFAWYVFAGADGQAIARDVFLDGSTFRGNSPSVDKSPVVGSFHAGVAAMLYGVRLTYTHTWQTESFSRQRSGLFNFGSLALSARF
ncbi:MAG: lipid A deacylase LpxR family protein [Gemmatimonadaceae bacterium]|nr:lipid A deacylase LpxR family protein [Acetobacteraceae bacterium]